MTQKVEGFVVIIRISEFSPESLHGVLVFITNAIPYRIVFPSGLDVMDKLGVFFPCLRMSDFKDGKRNEVCAGRTFEDLTLLFWEWLVTGDGAAGMTRFTTAPQRGIIGDRFQTDHNVGGNGPMRERPIMLWEGKRWGDPPPPSLDGPSCIAWIGVYKSREAPEYHS